MQGAQGAQGALRFGPVDDHGDISFRRTLRDGADVDSRFAQRGEKRSGRARMIDYPITDRGQDAAIRRDPDGLDLMVMEGGEKGALQGGLRELSLRFATSRKAPKS